MKVSVIICTYNRAAILVDAIQSIHNQDFLAHEFEIIIVDNNSSDDTKERVHQLEQLSPCAMTYIFEKRQGLSYARNTGLSHAKGDIVVFTDDDIIADVSWLQSLCSALDAGQFCAVGGPVCPLWPGPRPDWLTEELLWSLSISDCPLALQSGEYSYPDCPIGANMAFRHEIITRVGGFSPELGRAGESLVSGEEIDLFRKIHAAGLRVVFAPGALIHHRIAPERLTKEWFLRRYYDEGRTNALLVLSDAQEVIVERIGQQLDGLLVYGTFKSAFMNECTDSLVKGYLESLLCSHDERMFVGNLYQRAQHVFIKKFIRSLRANGSLRAELRTTTDRLQTIEKTLLWTLLSRYYHFVNSALPVGSRRRNIYENFSKVIHGTR